MGTTPVLRRCAGALIMLSLVMLALAFSGDEGQAARARSARVVPDLVFGIYPGGGVGTVEATPAAIAEDTQRRLAALSELRAPGRPFVMHLYTAWDGTRAEADHVEEAVATVAEYTREGFDVELVLRYRPQSRDAGAAGAYASYVAAVTRRLAGDARVRNLQITNEPNVTGAPDASDGDYPGVRDALVRGVLAAAEARKAAGTLTPKIGFNHAASNADRRFWQDLRTLGGRPFAAAVDWVGTDVYPGTWSGSRRVSERAVRREVTRALSRMRKQQLPLAGLGRHVKLHVSENGFPTGPGRTDADQATVLRASVRAARDARRSLGVSDFRWFDLRDADSDAAQTEMHYGLLRSDYGAKPAFAVLQGIVRGDGVARGSLLRRVRARAAR